MMLVDEAVPHDIEKLMFALKWHFELPVLEWSNDIGAAPGICDCHHKNADCAALALAAGPLELKGLPRYRPVHKAGLPGQRPPDVRKEEVLSA
jgi:hypothetical protein